MTRLAAGGHAATPGLATEALDVMDAALYSDNELRAAVARERERAYAEIRQLAVDHGAVYFAEPRPCDCKRGCAQVVSKRMPFAPLIGGDQ